MVYLNFSFEKFFGCYQLSEKKLLHICLMLESLLFQENNDIVAMLLLTFLHFIIYYVNLTNHINFQMLKLEILIFIDFQSLILLNS